MAKKRGYRALKKKVKTALKSAREGFDFGEWQTRPDLAARLDEDMKSSPHSTRAIKGRAVSKLGDKSRAKTAAFKAAFKADQDKSQRASKPKPRARKPRTTVAGKLKGAAKYVGKVATGPRGPFAPLIEPINAGSVVGRALAASKAARKAAKGRAVSKLGDKSRAKTKAFYDAQAKANRGMAMDSKAHAERAKGGVKEAKPKAKPRATKAAPRDTMRRPPTEGPFYKKTKFKMKPRPGPDFEVVRPTLVDVKKKRKKPAGRRVRR